MKERKELKTYKYDDIHFTSTKFLLKEEADQVMDAYEERIKELERENAALRKTNKFNNEMLIESIKELAKGNN